ncbi:hypothetical protein [Agromyces lapidis]|uniref:Uncharacterized protein n=1 Tax=Agromyces lapidis TaxID=279574 RepID=A0ABV5SP94_9MICO|nr:hypothetical protein [Agromyces lapidis]
MNALYYTIESRSDATSEDWSRYLGPWSFDDVVQFVSYWNRALGYNKFRYVKGESS